MIHFNIYNNIDELPQAWNTLATPDVFLKTPFLKALETSSPSNITSYYLCVFNKNKLIGIAILQRVQMYADDIFRKTSDHRLMQMAKQLIAKIVKGNAIIVGNLMHTGQHGLFFVAEEITQGLFLNQVNLAIEKLSKDIKKTFNKKIRIIAFKDYFEHDPIHSNLDFFKAHNLFKVQVQPNMLFSIPSTWTMKEDYISAFTKKYRDRYKRARKKGAILQYKELDLEAIKRHSNTLYKLYENVSDNAGVNSFKLSPDHFYSLKVHLKDDFKVFGYYLNNELVGFYTLIINNNELETYFLGYNQELQHKYQMYLNMLYDMVNYGIENKFKTIVFARTAMEIKSSIGAKPHTMHIYLNHTNNFIANTLLKFIVKYMNPIREWQERHPFK
ncbi:GNAT family N-acetyltransferase [Lacinutrix iliipiscaria]|uniref:GNAT family N-acetyltransferase n=1 Tax=Lacinutrix iliipiscaria TaxID=1230532 RepID=A0ABW5WKR1_9FLAO